MTLSSLWSELEREPGAKGEVSRRLYPESRFDLFLRLNQANKHRFFVFERDWKSREKLPGFPATKGIACRAELHDAGGRLHLVVELTDPTLVDVFTPLVEDLSQRIVAADDEGRAVSELAAGLADWQRLFEQLANTGMATLVRRGLVGELMVLRDLILPRLSPEASIEAWTGPLRANQDFQLSEVAIEIKVTTGKQPQGFRVANERELDSRNIGVLVLAHRSLDERLGGEGETLNQVVESVEVLLGGSASAASNFREHLSRVGYLRRDSDLYNEPRYALRQASYFDVVEGFPRLTESDLASGVGDVQYSVSLAACSAFSISVDRVQSLIELSAL